VPRHRGPGLADAAFGSRNIGKTLAKSTSKGEELAINQRLPIATWPCSWRGRPRCGTNRRDLFWAQRYAHKNRGGDAATYQDVLRRFRPMSGSPTRCNATTNYVAEEVHFGQEVLVTRKGAIRAGKGELGIHPRVDG